jgi:hypothetical protein
MLLDGQEHPSQNVAFDTVIWKRVDANAIEVIQKRRGKVVQTGTNVVSKDGKTTTVTFTRTNAKGKAITTVQVYDKQ